MKYSAIDLPKMENPIQRPNVPPTAPITPMIS